MDKINWDRYEISLTPQAAPVPPAPAPVSVARPLASCGARLGAVVLDGLFGWAPLAAAFGLPAALGYGEEARDLRLRVFIGGTLTLLSLQWALLSLCGQTLGKLAMGLRIVDAHDNSNPGFWRAVVVRVVLVRVVSLVPFFGQFYLLIDVVAIFGEERRCFHDYCAGTKVIKT